MKILKEGKRVGAIEFGKVLEFETEDDKLLKIIQWAVTNPVPFVQGSEENGIFNTSVTYVPLGSKLYPTAFEEFLNSYGYLIK